MSILTFIFASGWHFLGTLVLLSAVGQIVVALAHALRSIPEGARDE